jgi:hypothetical protein
MIDRPQRALQHVDSLPVVVREEIAEHIEELMAPTEMAPIPQDFAEI